MMGIFQRWLYTNLADVADFLTMRTKLAEKECMHVYD